MNGINLDLSQKTLKTMGDIDQVQKLAIDMRVTRMLRSRRNEILQAIGDRTCEPAPEVLDELNQLEEELGIAPVQFDTAIVYLREELREQEANQDDLAALIVELTARGMFDELGSTREDTDGCAL